MSMSLQNKPPVYSYNSEYIIRYVSVISFHSFWSFDYDLNLTLIEEKKKKKLKG